MAPSTSSESLFSTADLRSCLKPENANAIIYLNKKTLTLQSVVTLDIVYITLFGISFDLEGVKPQNAYKCKH